MKFDYLRWLTDEGYRQACLERRFGQVRCPGNHDWWRCRECGAAV